jgi:hypothetical protein
LNSGHAIMVDVAFDPHSPDDALISATAAAIQI